MIKKFIRRTIDALVLIFGKHPKLQKKVDYDNYWSVKRRNNLGKLSEFQKERADIILRHLNNNTSIKDVGCGDGAILRYLSKHIKFSRIYGIDISDKVLAYINKTGFIPIKLDLNDLTKIKKLPKTDYTLALEILEHLPNPEEVLLELLKTTNKKLIFSIPNTGFIGHRLRLLFGSFPLQWKTHPGEHLRFWTYRDIKWWLKELGLFKNSKIYLYEGLPLLNKFWPSLFSMGILVIIKK